MSLQTMKLKDTYLQVRVTDEEKRKLLELARKLDVSASQIVRDELRERIAEESIKAPRKKAVTV